MMSNQYTELYVTDIQITQITAVNKGGVFYIAEGDAFELLLVELTNVFAMEGAMLYSVAPGMLIKITNSKFIC